MSKTLLENLEKTIRKRSPILADRLQPGLPVARVQQKLQRAKVQGIVGPVVSLFSWRNGSRLDPSLTREQATPFPGSPFIFMDFEMMFVDFRAFEEYAKYHPRLTELVGRYFPLFWDGSDKHLAVDLKPSAHSRIILVDTQAEKPVAEAYASFEDFLKDAIRANEESSPLICFRGSSS